tara:strand:- start:9096 stop:9209 length:114 start_codon:yes stop_codon:yes gene_type:complete
MASQNIARRVLEGTHGNHANPAQLFNETMLKAAKSRR